MEGAVLFPRTSGHIPFIYDSYLRHPPLQESMAIYEVGTDKLRRVEETSFGTAGLGERADLQRLLRDQVTEVSPDTLVIAEEFSDWADSRRRIDLLGIDKEANLVVIELKRTDDGGHMELQAIRYAAMVSTLTSQRAVEIFNEYLRARGRDEDAEQQLLEFLEWDEFDEDKFAQDVRLVLVSADFSKELTSAVLWLNDKDLDIRCVRIKPYAYEGKTLIDVQQVVPLPEAADYQVQVRDKKRQERKGRRGTIADFTRYDVVDRWFGGFRSRFRYGRLLPLRLEGRLTTSRQPHWEGAPSLTWYAKALPKGETSHVDLEWGSSEGFDLRSYWKEEENNLRSVRPGTDATPCPIVKDSLPSINSIRPVTDLAHSWLISDLKELDWTSLSRVSLL